MNKKHRPQAPDKLPKKPRTLADVMKISLFVHQDGRLWIGYEKELPERLAWMEYDWDEQKLFFIGERGLIMDLGVAIPEKCKDVLLKTENVLAAHIEHEKIQDMALVPVTVRKVDFEQP